MTAFEDTSGFISRVERLTEAGKFRAAVDLCESIQLADELPGKFWFVRGCALEGLGHKLLAIEAYRCEIASVGRVPPTFWATSALYWLT